MSGGPARLAYRGDAGAVGRMPSRSRAISGCAAAMPGNAAAQTPAHVVAAGSSSPQQSSAGTSPAMLSQANPPPEAQALPAGPTASQRASMTAARIRSFGIGADYSRCRAAPVGSSRKTGGSSQVRDNGAVLRLLNTVVLVWLAIALVLQAPAQADRAAHDGAAAHCAACDSACGTPCDAGHRAPDCGFSAACGASLPSALRPSACRVAHPVPAASATAFSFHVAEVPSRPPLA